uniref:Testis development-related protein-like n=1 Tax=Hippocampus comes TaxID=109280 RepID=A0A3Q2XK92_HIPCM
QQDEAQNVVSQLARKMQGAGTKSWNRLSALFNKEDEHQLLQETPIADPLAVKPEEPSRPTRRSGFWDSFAANWAAKKQAEAAATRKRTEDEEGVAAAPEEEEEQSASAGPSEAAEMDGAEEAEPRESDGNNGFSKYITLGGGAGGDDDAAFKWDFVTSKLAELRRASLAK